MTTRQPYERLPNETGPAWRAFLVYRDMGPARTVAEVIRQLGKASQHVYGWSKKYKWKGRVLAWDKSTDDRVRLDSAEAIVEMKKRQIEIAQDKQDLVKMELAKWLSMSRKSGDPVMALKDLVALFKLGVDVERLSRGEATDKIDTPETFDYSKLSTAKLKSLKSLLDEARRND